jgi:type IV pilus assembly protein PilM
MAGMSNSFTVVEIGSSNIKLVEAAFEKDKIYLNKFSVIPVSGVGSDDNVSYSKTITALIKAELTKQNFNRRSGIILIPNSNVISREIMLPVMPLKAIENSIKFEAGQYIPVNLANYRLDYKILEEIKTEDGNKYRVYLVAVPSGEIDTYTDIMLKNNVDLKIVDINSNALCKLFLLEAHARYGDRMTEESFAILDIGSESAHIAIVARGTLQFEKKLSSFNGNILTSLIAKYLGISPNDAEKEKIINGRKYVESDNEFDEDNEQSNTLNGQKNESNKQFAILDKEINKLLSSFINELGGIINYHYSKGFSHLNQVFLTGGASQLGGLDTLLSQSLNIKTEILDRLECVKNNSGKDIKQYLPFLTNVLGAVCRTDEKEGKK